MADDRDEIRDKLRRTLQQEFVQLEYDFDATRVTRDQIIDKLGGTIAKLELVDEYGKTDKDTTPIALQILTTTLKALSDKENAQSKAVGLKLKSQEQEISSAAAAKERIAIILHATAPGALPDGFDEDEIAAGLEAMAADIGDFETKISARDLSD